MHRDLQPLVGASRAIENVRVAIREYGKVEAGVLILGETGTGKGVAALNLHAASRRCDGPLLAVNCAALSVSLFESELFGNVRGAYTGADRNRPGLVGSAAGGTLFLDEIGELPAEAQPKLLHLLEDGTYRPVGAASERRANVRVIAATNEDLRRAVERGAFRADLYYRLSVLSVRLPALRERVEDVPELVRWFMQGLGAADREVCADALAELAAWSWPGNVRELRHTVERTLLQQRGRIERFEIDRASLGALAPGAERAAAAGAREVAAARGPLPDGAAASRAQFREHQRLQIVRLLNDEQWNVSAAARRLGLSRGALRSRMRTLGLQE